MPADMAWTATSSCGTACFGRPRNLVVLPPGWTVTASAMPVVVDETGDGRQRLTYENARPDEMQVLIRARRTR